MRPPHFEGPRGGCATAPGPRAESSFELGRSIRASLWAGVARAPRTAAQKPPLEPAPKPAVRLCAAARAGPLVARDEGNTLGTRQAEFYVFMANCLHPNCPAADVIGPAGAGKLLIVVVSSSSPGRPGALSSVLLPNWNSFTSRSELDSDPVQEAADLQLGRPVGGQQQVALAGRVSRFSLPPADVTRGKLWQTMIIMKSGACRHVHLRARLGSARRDATEN